MKVVLKFLPVLALYVLMTSCIPQKKLLLLQEKKPKSGEELIKMADQSGIAGTYKIQPNDYLFIYITSVEGKNTDFFNMPVTTNSGYTENNQMLVGYYVSDSGYIHFPFTGDVYVWGKTLDECRIIMEEKVKQYVGTVNVNVKLMNNTVSVMGEVNFQGNYRITKAKLTVLEAITLAGGFNDFAKRDMVQLVRNTAQGPIMQTLDLSNKEILNSDLIYIYPNDLIYVQPMKAKTWGIGPTFSLALLSSALTIVILIQAIL
jgi:polysaccharide export outer membrane protein